MDRRLTLLSKQTLHDAITTNSNLEKTGRVASVIISSICIITLFAFFENTVAADTCRCNECGFYKALTTATISRDSIDVITFFSNIQNTISTIDIRVDDAYTVAIIALQTSWTIGCRPTSLAVVSDAAITRTFLSIKTAAAIAQLITGTNRTRGIIRTSSSARTFSTNGSSWALGSSSTRNTGRE
jgi:hypothetical protein